MIIGSATKIVIIKLIVPLLELVSKVYKFKICLMRTERLGHLALNTQVFFIKDTSHLYYGQLLGLLHMDEWFERSKMRRGTCYKSLIG